MDFQLFGQAYFQMKKRLVIFIITIFMEIVVFNANNIETDHTPCLSVPFYGMLGINRVNQFKTIAIIMARLSQWYKNKNGLFAGDYFLQ